MTIPTAPPIDPVATGARILITGALGTVADVAIPGGAFDPVSKTGWKVNGAGKAFTFSSKTGVSGITKVSVKGSKTPGLQKIKVTGKNGAFAVTPASLPLAVTFVLDSHAQCGTADFAGPSPTCAFDRAGKTLKCK